jgi:N-acetylglucosaminyl-diphospho-decaprenol L-rhamnosyltransferase
MRVSPIIVNYGTAELTLKCVRSIIEHGVAAASDIVVVDNLSPDDSVARLERELPPEVRLMPSDINGGFSAGVNLGARVARGDMLLILNPDTYFLDQSFTQALQVMAHDPQIGVLGLELVNPDGSLQHSARRFYTLADIILRRLPVGEKWPFTGRMARHMMVKEWRAGRMFDADWVMGTGLLIRADLFRQLGGMDETYFLYMEDVDLCARVWLKNKRVVCLPGARLVHDHQRSSATSPLSWAGRVHMRSFLYFRSKYRVPLWIPPAASRLSRQ